MQVIDSNSLFFGRMGNTKIWMLENWACNIDDDDKNPIQFEYGQSEST